VTGMALLPFFIEFLKEGGRFEKWVSDCPIKMTSPNAGSKADILGTYLLSALSGQNRYAQMTALRNDGVNPGLLGMEQVMSEDAARRAFKGVEEEASQSWQRKHLNETYEALLDEPYIMDIDATVKPLYGKQEGAVVGYNPHKPGRPSHVYHTYWIANLRLVMDVDVEAGNRTASKYSLPGLWRLLDELAAKGKAPWLTRGDCGFGNEGVIVGCEERGLDYLFKLRMTANVKKLANLVSLSTQWVSAGAGWEGVESELKLSGWSKTRRVVVLRRRLAEKRKRPRSKKKLQDCLPFLGGLPEPEWYEYAVLVTSLKDEILSIAQLYRDRADCENGFDELKNQWGWGGYTTRDLKRCQISARIVAQVFNWWSIFVRLVVPDKHLEGGTSRPLLLNAIGRQTRHAGQTTLKVTSTHAKRESVAALLTKTTKFLKQVSSIAEQFKTKDSWTVILSAAFRAFLQGRLLGAQGTLISSG
jgi:hypothetical protein